MRAVARSLLLATCLCMSVTAVASATELSWWSH
jgi:hypothetical protein